MSRPRILAFSGSIRRGSFSTQLLQYAVKQAKGADVTVLDLADYPLPIMNQNIEAESGLPEIAVQLKTIFSEHDGLLVATPEYNGSITPLLKNTLDWVSRRGDDSAPLVAYKNKVAGLLGASPGRLGGLRGLVHVRQVLTVLGVVVLPQQIAVSSAASAFDDDGNLVQDHDTSGVANVVDSLVLLVSRLQ